MSYRKPMKAIVPWCEARAWRGQGWIWQEKMDGIFTTIEAGGLLLAGERLADGRIFAFDVLEVDGQDISCRPLRERREPFLGYFSRREKSDRFNPSILAVSEGFGGEFVEAVMVAGGEGVVAKCMDDHYGPMLAYKRRADFLCVVSRLGMSQSVELCDAVTGAPRGRVALFGGKCERVRVGSILKITGQCLTPKGCIREPRPCDDAPNSWLVKY